MKRYQSTGTITIRCYADNPEDAELSIKALVNELRMTPGAHISMAEHHQKPGTLVLERIA